MSQLPPSVQQWVDQTQAVIDQLRATVVAPPPPVGVIRVKVGESIQAALDLAPDGTEIRIAPGAYVVNLVLPAKKSKITLRTDLPDPPLALPWVTPALVGGKLATLTPQDPALPIIGCAPAAHDYTLRLLEIGPNLGLPDRGLVDLGQIGGPLADIPVNITVDQCYVHGSDAKGGHRGLMINGKNAIITRCYLSNFWELGRDSQAIGIASGPGPFLVESNYLEATGENMMFGGSDPVGMPGVTPSDIIVRGNYFFKPLSWKPAADGTGGRHTVKNLFELKHAARVLVEGNVFENNWTDGQAGSGIVFTVRNQDGGCPWCTVRDVVFRSNLLKNIQGFAFNVLGSDNNHPSVQAVNLLITQNLILGAGGGVQMDHGFVPTVISHNTQTGNYGTFLVLGSPMPPGSLTYTDNVTAGGLYGIAASGLVPGLPSLVAMNPDAQLHHNVIEGNLERTLSYPPGNYPIPPGSLAGKLDPSWKYLGPEASSDGAPLGVDVAALRAKIPWYAW
jgi:hypothetical protein